MEAIDSPARNTRRVSGKVLQQLSDKNMAELQSENNIIEHTGHTQGVNAISNANKLNGTIANVGANANANSSANSSGKTNNTNKTAKAKKDIKATVHEKENDSSVKQGQPKNR